MRYFRNPSNQTESGNSKNALLYGSQVLLAFGVSAFLLLAGSLAWVAKPTAIADQGNRKNPSAMDEKMSEEVSESVLEEEVELNEAEGRAEEIAKLNKFLGALSAALKRAGVSNKSVEASGTIRLGANVAVFPVGTATLPPSMLAKVDKVGIVLSQALKCLDQKPVEKPSPNILLEGTQMLACQGSATEQSYFQCDTSFSSLSLESILLEGHADARAVKRGSSSFKDNLNLSSSRGEHVLRRLYSCSPKLGSIGNAEGQALFGASGHSTQRFAVQGEQLDASNRRVEIKFIPALDP